MSEEQIIHPEKELELVEIVTHPSPAIKAIVKRLQDASFTVRILGREDRNLIILMIRKKIGNERIGIDWAIMPDETALQPDSILLEEADRRIAQLRQAIAKKAGE